MTRVTARYLYDLAFGDTMPASVAIHLMRAADELTFIEAGERELEAEHVVFREAPTQPPPSSEGAL